MQDIEFTVEEGRLYLLQTRSAKRTAAAALKAAVSMVDEGLISREEAVVRIDPSQLDQLLHPMIDPSAELEVAARGLNASPGAACGAVVLDADTAEERGKAGESVILVRWETTPDDIHGLIQAAGILTAHGGMTSHAAVVARGMGKPCVAGCEELTIDLEQAHARDRRAAARRGRHDHDRRRHRPGRDRRRAARAAADQRGLRDDPRLGRRAAAAEGARERRHARGRRQGPRLRRAGDRPLPHRAHVHGRGPAPGRARDDHGLGRGRAPRRARQAAAAPAGRLRGDLRGDGGPAGDDPPARPAAARVPAAARGGQGRADARADQGAAGVEPDARHPRLPARPALAGDLRDAGAGDHPRGRRRRGAHGRGAARRDHAPARRLRRGAAPPARDHDRDRAARRARRSSTSSAR